MKRKDIYLSLIILALVDLVETTSAKTIHKRDLIQMCRLIHHHTDMDSCLAINNYGNYCGYGQKECSIPVDPIDSCCMQHDFCYMDVNCWINFPLALSFRYTCENGQCTCTDPKSFWRMCRRDICECDMELARCFGRTQHLYNSTYKNYRFREI